MTLAAFRPDRIDQKKLSFGLLVAVLTVVIATQDSLWSHVTDDAYISFRYVDRLAAGDGLTFNPGEKIEGFSNPLWILILALVKSLLPQLPTPDTARFLGLLFTLVSVFILWRTNNLGQDPVAANRVFTLTAVMLILTPGIHYYATAGLEGPLFMLLITYGVSATLRPAQHHRLFAAAAFGFAAITRPEGALYGILWFVFTLPISRAQRLVPVLRSEVPRLIVFVTPSLTYQVFRLIYFDAWVPNTFLAKPPGTFGYGFGIPYLGPWITAAGGPMFLALCLFRWQPSEFELKLRRASLGPMLACAVFVVYAQGDWMLFGRFVIPVWPVVALLTSVWLSSLMDHQSQISALRWRSNVSVLFLALALSMAATLAWLTPLTDYVTNHGLAAMLMRGHDQMTVGHWLTENANDGATLVTLRLGGISYGAPHIVVWDLGGLTNREEALYTRQASLYPLEPHPVFQRGPDIIAHIVYPVLGYEDTLDFSCWLLENYFFARSFAQGDYGSVDIWVSQQTSNKTLKHPFTPVDLPDNMVNEAQCE